MMMAFVSLCASQANVKLKSSLNLWLHHEHKPMIRQKTSAYNVWNVAALLETFRVSRVSILPQQTDVNLKSLFVWRFCCGLETWSGLMHSSSWLMSDYYNSAIFSWQISFKSIIIKSHLHQHLAWTWLHMSRPYRIESSCHLSQLWACVLICSFHLLLSL